MPHLKMRWIWIFVQISRKNMGITQGVCVTFFSSYVYLNDFLYTILNFVANYLISHYGCINIIIYILCREDSNYSNSIKFF
jgi:hypothetical protein